MAHFPGAEQGSTARGQVACLVPGSAETVSALLPGGDDTIVALSTPAGRSAVAMIRLSGVRALAIARALGAYDRGLPEARHALYTRVRDPHTLEPLDSVVMTWFAATRSYTGEELVEITTHGGTVAPMRVLAACAAAGARPALPGEFTRRAVLNGRLDLLQAEAVADIIDARTSAMQQQALAHLDGGLSRRLLALRDEVLHLEALIAYDVDFPEEDDGPVASERVTTAIASLRYALRSLIDTAPRGVMLRDGVLVVIAGPPNAGKSSLFNALLGEARAIVTAVPGTTRDAIEAVLDRKPMPLRLVDTAGIRDTDDELEQLGIEVSSRYVAQAHVVLACGESIGAVADTAQLIGSRTAARVLRVLTKSDLPVLSGACETMFRAGDPQQMADGIIAVSAEHREGLGELLDAIDAAVDELPGTAGDVMGLPAGLTTVITRERHKAGITQALAEVEEFERSWCEGVLPLSVASVHLLAAREALGGLVGTIDTEDVLDRVFRDFCIGK